jgi:hypothetical protein
MRNAASTTGPFPTQNQNQQPGTPGLNERTRTRPRSATTQGTPSPGSDSRRKTGGSAPGTNLDRERLPNTQDPKLPSERVSRVGASPARVAGSAVRACAGCGITAEVTEHGKLMACTGCRSVCYCGKACQKADWPAHKATCKRLQAAGV